MEGPAKGPLGRAQGWAEGPMERLRPLEWRRPRNIQHAAVVLLLEKMRLLLTERLERSRAMKWSLDFPKAAQCKLRLQLAACPIGQCR